MAIKSPCIDRCRLEPDLGLCIGCWRTDQEIEHWARLKPAQKQQILAMLPRRRPGPAARDRS
ncbi:MULTISPECIES: DUF1289 domain-containing protein [unclassified Iodidimonas]|uniref:DUF1289 domain-containing protein n=1 Tax=unclassified Iodidimonas TaxID=2626145 RepID=UPI002483112D|nr:MULTISPECIES: DUF1289 domain-containing protein [unclassified Iodidimonas]